MAGGILGRLVVEKLDDGRFWRLDEPFVYYLTWPEYTESVHVPAGFKTDFASVPRVAHGILSPTGKIGKPAVVHDKLYRAPVVIVEEVDGPRGRAISRADADRIFLEAMEVAGVSWWKRRLAYRAVRLGGWRPWNTYREEERGE